MNLRHAENYNIGLDIGTGSVGWAVTDKNGELYHFKKKPTWGSRLFPSAETAATARISRGQRRRYDRRRQRLDWLQEFFLGEMDKVDPEFFLRLRQARLLKEDREDGHPDYRWPLFNDTDFTERDYYAKFPTIYHLRRWLLETDEEADIRLIYLAFHNIVKTRGNFLHQDNRSLSAKNANMTNSLERLAEAIEAWCDDHDLYCEGVNVTGLKAVFEDTNLARSDMKAESVQYFDFDADGKQRAQNIAASILGLSADFGKVFDIEGDGLKFYLSNDEAADAFYDQCPDEGVVLYDAIRAAYSSFILQGILKGANGQTISFCKVREYEQYREDLRLLKDLVRQYVPQKYDTFFRGPHYEDERWKKDYDPSKAEGYTCYNLGTSKMSYENFIKEVKKLFGGTAAEADERYVGMIDAFSESKFLRRLKTSDNGSIPYQLHLEEMDAIIQKQGKYYPFLLENKEKIESLVSFRIPYYVGPLTIKNAAVDANGVKRFAWSEKQEGKESTPIRPWNWEEVIDKDKSAEAFIRRMTGTCTYLQGEPVLPRCSLVYEKFCVLNELNGAKLSVDGDKEHRLSFDQRSSIVDGLFKQKGSVSYKAAEDYLKLHNKAPGVPRIRGGQGESKFESKLSSYRFFCNVLEVDDLDDETAVMVEKLILWNTLFEDRDILKGRIEKTYGNRLTEDQIKQIVKKRFTGWGRLSKKFLCEIKADTANGPMSIMDILEEGNPEGKHVGSAMVLMEILHDEHFGFLNLIEQQNVEKASIKGGLQIDDLPGSPAIRRGVNQALRIVEEIVSIAGGRPPVNIFVEVTRDDDKRKKGKRTSRRYDNLKEALAALKDEGKEVLKELSGIKAEDLDERLSLYFMQNGKCMYSGRPLDIRRVMSGDQSYQVDHIIPRSYTTDNSFDNKVLVYSDENQKKSDALLIDSSIRQKMSGYWRTLHDAGLISEKKFNNLMRSSISDKQLQGFINRQLVETSQIVKFVRMMLNERYPDTKVESIKASLSHQLREEQGFIKCREANNYHHAHDALLAAEIGRFIQLRHSGLFENPIGATHIMKEFIRSRTEYYKKTHKLPGSATFVIGSFLTSGFDKETGEIYKDTWDAEAECAKIRRFLNYKDCYISRMPEVTSGAFWDATIYSPKGQTKDLSLPLKKGLDPNKYGSYSREQFAYFFVFRAMKKDKAVIEFAPVPVSVASIVEARPEALDEFAKQLAEASNLVFGEVLRSKIYKYQLIELQDSRLYITGQKEVRNASELAFSQEEMKAIAAIVDRQEVSEEDLARLFQSIVHKYSVRAVRLGKQLGIEELSSSFQDAPTEAKKKVISELIAIANAGKNMIDISDVGGAKHAGCMLLTYSKLFSDINNEFVFIDQSVTGMFERQQKVEL